MYNALHVSGSTPGILYGLPKIHKLLTPLRPIFAACGTPTYKLVKYLVPILSPLTENQYSVKNSYEFASELHKLNVASNVTMASFDIESLFTNIPVLETIDICIRLLFDGKDTVLGITKKLFRSMLELSVLNSYFLFDGQLYKQKDGVGMGLPLGPTFANLFLCFHEQKWLDDCPREFKPKFYRRYVDDCFLIFDSPAHVDSFLTYLNGRHPKIKFTKELENNGTLPFLDVNVKRVGNQFTTTVFRKPSFTGLGLSFFSFIPKTVKLAVIQSAIFRAFKLCSSFKLFDLELRFLRTFFKSNGFPTHLFDFNVRRFLDKQFMRLPSSCNVPKLKKYLVLPYFGQQSLKLQKDITDVLKAFYPYLDPRVVLRNTFTIGSLFRFKDKVPKACSSGVIDQFCCSSCGESYIGSTVVRLRTRVCQHMGVSDRTGSMLLHPVFSSIREHSLTCKSSISISDFDILQKTNSVQDLRILESLHIFKKRPKINGKNTAVPLNIAY